MKKINLLLVIILFISAGKVFGQTGAHRFYITTLVVCDSSERAYYMMMLDGLSEKLAVRLQKEYQCALINTALEIKSNLAWLRQKQLAGREDQEAFENEGRKVANSDFIVGLKIKVANNTAIIYASCSRKINAKVLSMTGCTLPLPLKDIKPFEKMEEELIDGLKEYEICRFKGNVKVHVKTSLKKSEKEESPVYCNNKDGIFKRVTTQDNYSDQEWTITRGQKKCTGNVKFTSNELLEVEEQNDCYQCGSGREGGRISSEKTTKYAEIQGLSSESEVDGVKTDDADVDLVFLKDGTYLIKVSAASFQGDLKIKTSKYAQGTCDNESPSTKSTEAKADISLSQTWGPFPGTIKDKTLSQKKTIETVDPTTKEKTTITYEYSLTKD